MYLSKQVNMHFSISRIDYLRKKKVLIFYSRRLFKQENARISYICRMLKHENAKIFHSHIIEIMYINISLKEENTRISYK